ncbi:STAS domain-containing protein [Actinoplanes solisilvae]|uniref:STAS domain-containing protein n=1 Tax=Actinoplanes solisilvae TaxID=2486853 RepID=UPI000FD6FD6F|nr:STAS domain-containing protein [Actinoplanes solisilvae]
MVKSAIDRNLDTGVTTVRLAGGLTPGNVPEVRTVIAKAAAECPAAVVVDLAGLDHDDDPQLTVFATVTHDAQLHWGVPVLLCAAGPELRRGLGAFRTYVALYEDRAQAALAVNANVPRWISRHLPNDPASAFESRAVTGEACLTWGLPDLRNKARLVASELASNAILHAGTEFDLTVVHTGRYLRIAVQDGSAVMPRVIEMLPAASALLRPGSGRGLRVVAALCAHWGATPVADGKIVWALLKSE